MIKLSKLGSGDLSNITTEAILKKIDSFDRVTVTSKLLEYLKRHYNLTLKEDHEFLVLKAKRQSYSIVPVGHEDIKLLDLQPSNIIKIM
ncbi:hypothetical protein [Poseidonibacter antarcticus]|uniref:hypothetical protein n=1 Tax=Poseidonibacter antarcticus TaxID=2478538 RepID=UPI000EF4C9A3|nr:hypothetical protein [Poseidonibacter antarcticus]